MKVRKEIKIEKDQTPFNIRKRGPITKIINADQFTEHCTTEAVDQRFDVLQTKEKIVESKDIEKGDKSDMSDIIEEEEIKPFSKWHKYKKKYSKKWENDPKLKAWIQKDSVNPNKVWCRVCHKLFRAHKYDLYKHSGTNKHRRNCKRSSIEIEEGDINIDLDEEVDVEGEDKEIILSITDKQSPDKRVKREKMSPSDESYIFVEAGQNMSTYSAEAAQNGNIFMAYAEDESFLASKSPPDSEISEIANRIGIVIIKEVGKLLRTNKNILRFFKDNGEIVTTESNVNKLVKICVGHLAQRFLVETAVESIAGKSVLNNRKDLSEKLKFIEEKLETTVSEMKALKSSLNDTSQSLPLTTFDFSKIFDTSPCD